VGKFADSQAHNRGVELDAMMEADRMRMDQDRDRAADETGLWRKLQAVNYMKSGGAPANQKPMMSASGRAIPQFDFGPTPISDADKQMATTLEGQLLQRLKNPPTLRDYDSKMKPGTGERIAGYAAPAMGILSTLFRNQPSAATPTPTPNPAAVLSDKPWYDGMDFSKGLGIAPKDPTNWYSGTSKPQPTSLFG
jgi:hypothetical protein